MKKTERAERETKAFNKILALVNTFEQAVYRGYFFDELLAREALEKALQRLVKKVVAGEALKRENRPKRLV